MRFYVPADLLEQPIRVWLIGVGGTGSEMLEGLARLHTALLALGHPGGLHVTAFDGDTVSQVNIGRQRFWAADVGHNKATVAIQRLNLFVGLTWQDQPVAFDPQDHSRWPDLLITCVDKAAVRAAIGKQGATTHSPCLWLDSGNGAYAGQVILGHLSRGRPTALRLPNVYDFYGRELARHDETDDTPSCGLAAALAVQSLAINRLLADLALALLYQLWREGWIAHHGQFVDLRQGVVTPLKIDPDAWRFLGYKEDRIVEKG